jgi:carboxyl-terminal processing protease
MNDNGFRTLVSGGCKILIMALLAAILVSGGFLSGYLYAGFGGDAEPATPVAVEATSLPLSIESQTVAPSATPAPTAEPATPVPLPTLPPDLSEEQAEAFETFWEAWRIIEQEFYGDLPTPHELTYGAIRGAIDTLDDPFTGFIDPSRAELLREDMSGTYAGIGALVTMREDFLTIVRPFEGSPAEMAGLRRDDVILKAGDVELTGLSIYEAIAYVRGPAGSQVELTIAREGEESFQVTLTRAEIEIPVVETEMRDDGIAYVSLFDFSTNANVKLESAIEDLLAQDPQAFIFDLRGNSGGWLDESVKVANLFLPQDEVVLLERFQDGTSRTYRTADEPVLPDLPLVVLVDAGTASASEIVAGALQDYERALLIGEQTFGKGAVQFVYNLDDGSQLRVTAARWFTPDDHAIHGEGLTPDIEVLLTDADIEAESDSQLERAVEVLLSGQ